jgi:hypothetical protein
VILTTIMANESSGFLTAPLRRPVKTGLGRAACPLQPHKRLVSFEIWRG